jgi:D-3-phosphoglycerate dehydrogenase / 2-oxoglutarate reductase
LTLDRTDGQPAVLLLENIHPDATARLVKDGYQVQTAARALDEDELIAALAGVQVLGIRSGTKVTERVLGAAPGLLAVGAFCIGVNQIDLAAASRRGVAVFNAPFSNTRSVVELALAEIIALTRRVTDKNAQMHAAAGTSPRPAATRCAGGGWASSGTATLAASSRSWPRASA